MEFEIREKVKERYGEIAAKVNNKGKASCCGSSSCCESSAKFDTGYTAENLKEVPLDALTASLGCSNPLLFAKLKKGETVLDLGSGGGIDVLAASRYVGESGKVYGLDMTDEMLKLANRNKAEMGVTNVDFLKGYIEDIPLKDESIDVIMSNCVINLSEDKEKAMQEAYRVLKKGGRIAIADMVTLKSVPDELKKIAEAWSGCLAGTLQLEEYRTVLEKAGFSNIEIEPVSVFTKAVIEDMFREYLNDFPEIDLNLFDSAFASAHIKAVKI